MEVGVRFLDNMIVATTPLRIRDMTSPKIGLGVMGFADLLIPLGIPYNSEEGVELASDAVYQTAGHDASSSWRKSGILPNCSSVFEQGSPCITPEPLHHRYHLHYCHCSSGIEPIFAGLTRVLDNDRLIEVNPMFETILREEGLYSAELIEEVAQTGNVKDMEAIPEELRRILVTAYEVTPEWHIRMQAAFQEFTDNAVSKTVNFPKEAAKEDIRAVYELAYELGCRELLSTGQVPGR